MMCNMKLNMIKSSRAVLLLFVCALSLTACKSGAKQNDPRTMMIGEPPVEWRLVKMQGAQVESPKAVTLRLAKDGQATGGSFVNSYFGPFSAAADGSISFGQMGSTRMAGSPQLMQMEDKYFSLLEQVNRFAVAGDTLTFNRGDEALLEFVRQAN